MSAGISAHMRALNIEWIRRASEARHLFGIRWMGERFFHLPGDMQAIQELVWQLKPDRIVQTGIAAGGGTVFAASMLELLGGDGVVVAVEPNLREDVRTRLQAHRLAPRMQLVEGDSCAAPTLQAVRAAVADATTVLVILDLTHTHAHVLAELQHYAQIVTPGSVIVVMDTIMEYLPAAMFKGKPYGHGNNPATAVTAFLAQDDRFEVDHAIEDQVIMTLSPGGFLRRVR